MATKKETTPKENIKEKQELFDNAVVASFFYIIPLLLGLTLLSILLLNNVNLLPAIVYSVIATVFSHYFGKLLLGKLL